MKKSLIIIFIIILAIHIAALLILLFQKDSGERENPEPDNSPQLIPEPTIKHNGKAVKKKDPNVKQPDPAPKKKPIKKYPETIKYGPLDFKGAVEGTIDDLPESKHVNAGILVDSKTRKVLWSKNSRKAVPIASMTKMMTVLIVSEDIKKGKIQATKLIPVTKTAASIGGSDVWLDPRETFPLNELLKAVVIKSANDAAFLVAEDTGGGDVNNFVNRMNSRAQEMGLKTAFFSNPHGLPEKDGRDNVCSCADLVCIAEELLQYPEVIQLSSTKIDYLPRKVGKTSKTMLLNTNKLIRNSCPGVDGLKTGFTRKAGSCITVTCERNGRRLIAVLAGCSNGRERDALAEKLLDWGYKR